MILLFMVDIDTLLEKFKWLILNKKKYASCPFSKIEILCQKRQ